jgi:hypothetical protein
MQMHKRTKLPPLLRQEIGDKHQSQNRLIV